MTRDRILITPNFYADEFDCHDGTPYPLDAPEDGKGLPTNFIITPGSEFYVWRYTRLTPLCQTLEVVRAELGGDPMTIDSGYRDEAYDQRIYEAHVAAHGDDGLVAPASTSIHPKGGAADVIHAHYHPVDVYNCGLELFEAGRLPFLGGIGLYPGFVHFDVRRRPTGGDYGTRGHLAVWGGRRPSNVI